jgi:signal transduction histidine kinase
MAPADTEIEVAQAEIERLRQLNHSLLLLLGHELGSPLSLILAYLRLWQEHGAVRAPEELDLVLEQALRLKAKLDDLVLLEQLETGRWRIAREPIMLYPLIRRVLQQYTAQMEERNITVRVALGCSKRVLADAELMVRVLDHMLSNALKFSRAGTEIVLTTRQEGEYCSLTVADQGGGITPEQQALIFEPLYCIDLSLTRRFDSLGMGLKFVRSVVERHGGQLHIESDPGKGSAFSICLPFA